MKIQKRSKSSISINLLPNEILMEILKRVSVIDLLKYCRVCKKWKDLISSKNFKDLHLKSSSSSPPMVLVYIDDESQGESEILLLQNIWDTTRKRLTIRKFACSSAVSCSFFFIYGGLIVCYDYCYTYFGDFIFNPVSGDKLTIRRPMGSAFMVLGMFFNSSIKEYCILWGSFEKIDNVQCKMLVIGAEQSFKDLKPPNILIKEPEFPPVIIDDAYLYWLLRPRARYFGSSDDVSCEEIIMAFDTKSEEFSLMPHPGSTNTCERYRHTNMHIVKIDGCLSFVRLEDDKESLIVKIWTLKDLDKRLWKKTYKVSFNNNWDDLFANLQRSWFYLSHIVVMAFENGELLLELLTSNGDHKLYACNLKNGSVRKIGSKYHKCDQFYMYVPSFASLQK